MMTNEPDEATLWARERTAKDMPPVWARVMLAGENDNNRELTIRAEAHRAGQAAMQAKLDALAAALHEIAGNNWRDQSRARHVARAALDAAK
jgi:hypothetical protein